MHLPFSVPVSFFGGLILMVLFWGVLILAGYMLVRLIVDNSRNRVRAGGGNSARDLGERSSALTILEERYARGEVERDDFVQKRRDLLEDREGRANNP